MKKRTQTEHERINRHSYPGTRQMCVLCEDPTGRCEDDGLWSEKHDGWLCPPCYKKEKAETERTRQIRKLRANLDRLRTNIRKHGKLVRDMQRIAGTR